MCWKRATYIRPTRPPPTPTQLPLTATYLSDSGYDTRYDASTLLPDMPCTTAGDELCGEGVPPRFCNGNGVCCINRRVQEHPYCRCRTGFEGDHCERLQQNDWFLKELESQEAHRRMVNATITATVCVFALVAIALVACVVLIILRKKKCGSNSSHGNSKPAAAAPGRDSQNNEDVEMIPLKPHENQDDVVAQRDPVNDILLSSHRTETPPPNGSSHNQGTGLNQPGLSWRQNAGHGGVIRKSEDQSRSIPAHMDKLDINMGVTNSVASTNGKDFANGNSETASVNNNCRDVLGAK